MTITSSESGGRESHDSRESPAPVVQTVELDDAPKKNSKPTGAGSGGPRAFLHRLHVVAGIFVAPLLLVAAVTGLAYSVAPTLEKIVYHDELTAVSHAAPHSLEEQVAAAQRVHPDLPVTAVQVPEKAGQTTRVMFNDPSLKSESYRHAVFVDPGDLAIRGDLVQYGSSAALPLRAWLSEGHRRLWLGDIGRLYSETAASWMGALVLCGLWLWWDRTRRAKRKAKAAGPAKANAERKESPRARQRRKHATAGSWLAIGFLFLTITGLTWSSVAGDNIAKVREQLDWYAPKPKTTMSATAATDTQAAGAVSSSSWNWAQADTVTTAARNAGLSGKVEVTPPMKSGSAWVVKEARQEWRTEIETVAVDGTSGKIVDTVHFSQWPLAAKATEWLINAHMGILFGWVNQLVLAIIALGLIMIIARGYIMWFQRGVRGSRRPGRLPGPTRWRDIHPGVLLTLLLCIVVYSIIAPLFGVTLVAFVLLDWLWRLARKPRTARLVRAKAKEEDPVSC